MSDRATVTRRLLRRLLRRGAHDERRIPRPRWAYLAEVPASADTAPGPEAGGLPGGWSWPSSVSFDRDGHALRFAFGAPEPFVLAVADAYVAEQFEAAQCLGGLQVRMSAPRPGVVRAEGRWYREFLAVEGISAPAR